MRTGEFWLVPQELQVASCGSLEPGSPRGREKGLGRLRGLFTMTNGRRGQARLHEGNNCQLLVLFILFYF